MPAVGAHISLFAGVGMTDLAAEAAGYKTIATAEIDPWNRKLLQHRFPEAIHYDDVRHVRTSVAPDVGRPLMVSGGFPCQDVSAAGSGKGVEGGERSGLWAEFARIIFEFKPDVVLAENSPLLRSRGLHRVLADLYMLGYACAWDCIPAAAVGAPHLRDRIFIVAWPDKTALDVSLPGKYIGCATRDGIWSSHVGMVTRFPRAGRMYRGGLVQEQPALAPIKAAKKACLAHAVACPATPTGAWPTPAASIPQDGEGPETWLARRELLKAKCSNGNGAGMPLSIAVQLFPTPRAAPNEWRTTRNAPSHGKGHGKTLAGEVNDLERAAGRSPAPSSGSAGNVNPVWVEWLMGLPLGWTDLRVPNDALVAHPGWASEPARVPRTIADPPDRKARLRALGNGLVYQAALQALLELNPSKELSHA